MRAEPLACPVCHARHPEDERFCRDCGVPLVHVGRPSVDAAVSPRRERARKVKPQLAEGPLVRVVTARHQAEAEFLQGLLLEEGVPSVVQRSRGFDVPDLLAAGPRDVLVARSGLDTAREVLLQAEVLPATPAPGAGPRPVLVLAALVLGVLLVGLIVLALG